MVVGVLALGSSNALAAAPIIEGIWATGVTEAAAQLHVRIDPGDVSSSYHFDYVTEAAYQTNLNAGKDGFAGAAKLPSGAEGKTGPVVVEVQSHLEKLTPETTYRYRASVKNSDGSALSPGRALTTRGFGGPLQLLDGRGWEMVSPIDKNGGEVQGFGGNARGGVLQAAAAGGSVSFSSTSSFGGGQGAPTASQYIARRSAGGWTSENITTPLFSGGYGEEPDGVPYQLFSTDLARGLLSGVGYPPLAGTGAPAGYRNYYLRDNATGGIQALLSQPDVAALSMPPGKFELGFAGGSPDLSHVVLSTCAALTPDAVEVPDGPEACDPASANLYEWSAEGGLELVNKSPGETVGTPGARLAATDGAVSSDGSRLYWALGGDLFLREGAQSYPVGEGASFQTASADGSVAFFTKGEHLFRFTVATKAATDLTPGGEVEGTLGASADGSHLYYLTATGLFLWRDGATALVATAANASNYPPATGTARVSDDGSHLAFLSSAELTEFDNTGPGGKPVSEAFLYDAGAETLTCVSCNPTGARPLGPSSIPGAIANGQGEGATRSYKPRALSADGGRLFFDSADSLVLQDTNRLQDTNSEGGPDVYEWEAQGTGSCQRPGGCVQLISSGRATASFVDASADGTDAFFLTDGSLVPSDPGSADLYDARASGGFPVPPTPIPCEGDSCQGLPSPPDDLTPGTLVPSTGNPRVHFRKPGRKKPSHKKRHHQRKRLR